MILLLNGPVIRINSLAMMLLLKTLYSSTSKRKIRTEPMMKKRKKPVLLMLLKMRESSKSKSKKAFLKTSKSYLKREKRSTVAWRLLKPRTTLGQSLRCHCSFSTWSFWLSRERSRSCVAVFPKI